MPRLEVTITAVYEIIGTLSLADATEHLKEVGEKVAEFGSMVKVKIKVPEGEYLV